MYRKWQSRLAMMLAVLLLWLCPCISQATPRSEESLIIHVEEFELPSEERRSVEQIPKVARNKKWTITFNYEIDEYSAFAKIYVSTDKTQAGKIDVPLEVQGVQAVLNPAAETIYEEGREYFIIIEKGLESKNGKVLQKEVIHRFQIEKSQSAVQTLYKSSHFPQEYIEIFISEAGVYSLKGHTNQRGDLAFGILEEPHPSGTPYPIKYSIPIDASGFFKGEIRAQMTNEQLLLPDGNYSLGFFITDERDNVEHYTFYNRIEFSFDSGKMFFKEPQMLRQNQSIRQTYPHPSSCLTLKDLSEADIRILKAKVAEITAGASSDYEKVQKIHDWVADYVYYDYDHYLNNAPLVAEKTMDVLEKRITVCEGYANLTRDLMRAANLPTLSVYGYALGISAEGRGWNEVDHSKANHAWNEVYVDGRWIIIDVTWDSENSYKNGQKTYKGYNYMHFDMTEEGLSTKHKIMGFDE